MIVYSVCCNSYYNNITYKNNDNDRMQCLMQLLRATYIELCRASVSLYFLGFL